MVIRKDGSSLLVALIKLLDHSGLALPKGHKEKNETFEQTAKREVEEESGLNQLKLICELGKKERLDFWKKGWKKTHYFLFLTNQTSGKPTDPKHTEDLVWKNIYDIDDIYWPDQKEIIAENLEKIKSLIYLSMIVRK